MIIGYMFAAVIALIVGAIGIAFGPWAALAVACAAFLGLWWACAVLA